MEPTLIKLYGTPDTVFLRTITRQCKSSGVGFAVADLRRLEQEKELILRDGLSFAVLRRQEDSDILAVTLYRLSCEGRDRLSGWEQRVELPYERFMSFVKEEGDGRQERFFSRITLQYPRILFHSAGNLRAAVQDPLIRRKLSKFLRTAFRWPRSTEICLWDDFLPYSFTFREKIGNARGIFGGVILHNREQPAKAYYAIHT